MCVHCTDRFPRAKNPGRKSWKQTHSLMRGEAVFPKAWRRDCCYEKFDMDQKMAEMHDHLLHSICERTGLSEEEVNQKLMEISEAMNKGVDFSMNQLDDFLAQH